MYIFDLKDIVKTPEGEYAEVIDVGINEKNDTVYIVQQLETENYFYYLGKDLELIKR